MEVHRKVGETMKNCSNCANNTKAGCKALTKRIGSNCFAWADEKERIRRIDDIVKYSGGYLVSQGNRLLVAEKKRLMNEIDNSKKLFSKT